MDVQPIGSTDFQVLEGTTNTFRGSWYRFFASLRAAVVNREAASTLIVKSGAPAVSDVPAGEFRVIKNTSGPTYSLVVNDSGVLKSVTLT